MRAKVRVAVPTAVVTKDADAIVDVEEEEEGDAAVAKVTR